MVDRPLRTGAELSDRDIHALLDSEGRGVLSMGVDNRGYGVPLSYQYDRENSRIIMGFVNSSGSKRQEFANKTEEATFTVYSFDDVDSWKSVVVRGTLHPISESEVEVTYPFSSLFFHEDGDHSDEDQMIELDEYDHSWYELRIENLSGRHSG